jgi:hypothetical protein
MLALALLASTARGETEAKAKVPKGPLVERGTYVGLGFGAHGFLGVPGDGARRAWGQAMRLELRFAPFERLGLSVFAMASAIKPGADYTGTSAGGAQGDFLTLSPGLAVRVNLVGGLDRAEVRRWWIYARVGAGYSFFWPKALLPEGDLFVLGSLGFEYRTYVRHFSVGLEVMPSYYLTHRTPTVAVLPNLHFAF